MNSQRRLFILGDSHQGPHGIAYDIGINRYEVADSDIIQVGDVAFYCDHFTLNELERKRIEKLQEILLIRNAHLYIIRGNWDNPVYWELPNPYSNIHFVQDFTVLELHGKRIGCIGGALSVDRRSKRLTGRYFGGEGFPDETEKLDALTDLDILVTHTIHRRDNPFGGAISHFVAEHAKLDKDLYDALRLESDIIERAFDKIRAQSPNLKNWFYGHFHRKYEKEVFGVNTRCLTYYELYRIQ